MHQLWLSIWIVTVMCCSNVIDVLALQTCPSGSSCGSDNGLFFTKMLGTNYLLNSWQILLKFKWYLHLLALFITVGTITTSHCITTTWFYYVVRVVCVGDFTQISKCELQRWSCMRNICRFEEPLLPKFVKVELCCCPASTITWLCVQTKVEYKLWKGGNWALAQFGLWSKGPAAYPQADDQLQWVCNATPNPKKVAQVLDDRPLKCLDVICSKGCM